MRMWRLSGADYAERFDGGFGLFHDGRWNTRGRPITYCATGPALCVLEKLAHIEDALLLPDDTVLVRYDVPDDLRVEESSLDDLPEGWHADERLTRIGRRRLVGRRLGMSSARSIRHRAHPRRGRQKHRRQPSARGRCARHDFKDRGVRVRHSTVRVAGVQPEVSREPETASCTFRVLDQGRG